MQVGLSPSNFVLDGDPAPPQKGQSPQFSAHVYCGQTAGWTKMPLGTEVDLGPVDIVLDGVPALCERGHSSPLFLPISVVATVAHLSYCWALVSLHFAHTTFLRCFFWDFTDMCIYVCMYVCMKWNFRMVASLCNANCHAKVTSRSIVVPSGPDVGISWHSVNQRSISEAVKCRVKLSQWKIPLQCGLSAKFIDLLFLFAVSCEVLAVWWRCLFTVFCLIAVYKIILGTLENEASADVEWQHARYLRTAKKRKFLSAE